MNRRTMFSFNGFAFLPTVFVCVITFSQALSGQQWGPENNGFQMRIIAVDPGSDEQTPVIDESVATVNSFESAADVTLVAEIKNISTQEIRYVGVRYGDNVTSGHVGRSNTDFFGPLFFRCELKDSQGNPIERLGGSNDERLNIVEHSYENVSLLKAGESALLQLHPLRWDLAQQEQVLEGDYKIQIKYLGAEIQESCWNGELLSQEIAIKINGPEKDARPDLQWGEPKDKIRVAARYRLSDQRAENEEEFVSSTFPQESKVDVEFFIQNISTQTIEIESADWRQDDQVFLVTAAGEQLQQGAWYSGISPRKTFRLGPKQTAIIPSICIGFSADKATAEFSHPIGVVLEGQSGVFRVAHALSLRVRKSSEEGADEQAFDTLQVSTGTTDLTIRERVAADEPPQFKAELKFRKPDGTFADSGFVSVQHSAEVKLLFEGQLSGDTLPIECRDEQLTVVQRIPGCVAKRIRFIEPLKDAPTIVELQESSPITLRVIDGEGNPVSDADVRYFTYTTGKSSSHAFPMDGIKGAIHGTSDIEGNVAIDFLDPIEAGKAETMGNKLYWFYIEHPELAPTFVGPYEAGTQQEDVVLGEYLEIKGEVHGTPEELRNFAAEWDQPERLMRGNGIDYWIYADSAKLSIDFEDGKGTFTLSGLRPGKLRFIVTFAPRPHSVKHSYSRRDPGPDDVVFEFDVTESRDDIVLVPGNGFEEPADSSASGDGITDDGRP